MDVGAAPADEVEAAVLVNQGMSLFDDPASGSHLVAGAASGTEPVLRRRLSSAHTRGQS